MHGSAYRRLKRAGPEVVLALVILLSGVSLWQAWRIAGHFRADARETSRIYGEIIAGLGDPTPGADAQVLLKLVREIRATGLPVIVTDSAGRVMAQANLPFTAAATDPRVAVYAATLDAANPPITVANVGKVHFGALPIAARLKWLGLLQLLLLGTAVAAGVWAYRIAMHRDRDRLWVAMARESAHQLGTPLMSANAWVDRIADGSGDRESIARHLRADLERLQRVAQRFERIGRPGRRDRVALGVLVERVAEYIRPRLPRHAHAVRLIVDAPDAGPTILGDAVLLEWAMEALLGNAVDALSGTDGEIGVAIEVGEHTAVVRVRDSGPGIDPNVRSRLFEPGVSTKAGGWGIGLALARRIVEDMHDGRLTVGNPPRGAEFVVQLPIARA